MNGDFYLNGSTANGLKVKGGSLEVYTNTDSSVNKVRDIIVYGPDANRISTLRSSMSVSGNKELEIFVSQNVDGSSVFNSLRMTNDTEGNRRCFLNYSPATNSNSTDIATTAFVNSRLPYTAGTWTPELKGSSTAGEFTYVERTGKYIKIGRLVFIYGYITFSACTTVPAGTIKISGLPFKCMNGSGSRAISIWGRCNGLDGGSLQKIAGFFVNGNSTELSARAFNPWSDSDLGIMAFNEATWSTSDANGIHVKITAQDYTGVGISFGGCYMTD